MKYHVIINPVAASGRTRKCWKKIENMFSVVDYEVHYSTRKHGIDAICRELTEWAQEPVNLVLIGGDGTMNDAVNGIQNFENVRLGFIPCGSGNDMVRDMDLPKRKELVERILEGKVYRRVDIGEVVFHNTFREEPRMHSLSYTRPFTRRFNVSSGMGFDADVCERVANTPGKRLFNFLNCGKLIYLAKALSLIVRNAKYKAELIADGEKPVLSENTMFTAIMNHAYEGGGFRFCPDAVTDDGVLNLCIARHFTPVKFVKVFVHAFHGNHVKYTDHIEMCRAKSIRLKSERPMWIHTDGEVFCMSSDITVRILDEKLNLLI